ncbi:hypothetical protein CIW69_16430 [Enterobacter cloacae]|nr:hypothetical protein CIW69_16430 [Enterobacter cloacae]
MCRCVVLLILIVFSSTSFAFDRGDKSELEKNVVSSFISDGHQHSVLQQRMMFEYASWKGTRYLWGGDSHHGIDCSALTRRIIFSTVHLHLPRTAVEQSHAGRWVKKSKLRTGDLVFFMTKPHVRHVGIYVGKGEFIHASSSRGVMLSHLSDDYWQEHYLTARRVAA